jgi:hypothetical protein
MIGQLTTLLRVKQLKEEQAFRAVNTKRGQVAAAQADLAAARKRVDESAATLPAREAAIWDEILRKIIDLDEVNKTKGRVQALEREHAKLVDAAERLTHVLTRLENELKEAVALHQQATRTRDKYVELTTELKSELVAAAEFKEESEVEDMFSTRKKRSA